jgi:uncharacterized protein YceK
MLVVAYSGCAVSVSRGWLNYKENPRPYPSVRANFGYPEWPLNMKADGFDVAFDFSKPLSLLILPIDLPISIVVDTILLPMDLVRWRRDVSNEEYVSNALSSAKMPSADEFRKHYIPLYSSWVIYRYLYQPSDQISQTRLDMLLDAGVPARMLASSTLMNEAFAARLVDRMLLEAGSPDSLADSLQQLVQNKMIPPATLRRLAGLSNKKLLPSVAKNDRTPPDVLRILSEEHSCIAEDCIALVAGNSSSPPDLLSKLADNPKYFGTLLSNNSTPADALLKMINSLSANQLPFIPIIARHPNATGAVDDAIIKYGKQMFAKGGLSSDKRYMIDRALTELAKKDIPRDKLLALAALPYPTMLHMLSNNKNADADTLVAIVKTCRNRKVDPNDACNDDCNHAVEYAQQRLQNPEEGLNIK